MGYFFQNLLSEHTQKKTERVMLHIAIGSFVLHLMLILAVDLGWITLKEPSNLLQNPIAAIYTPFSFILIYEVYLLVYYLPRSYTTYVGKQYEIIVLIIIRRLFKDFANLSFSTDWFKSPNDLQFTYDLLTSLILFFLIYLFNKQNSPALASGTYNVAGIERYNKIKRTIATALVPVLLLTAIYSFTSWLNVTFNNTVSVDQFKNINNIFFEQFFMLLIIVDVLLLLFSFYQTDEFHKVIRNSGFVISTILLRLSFAAHGLMNNLLILAAIAFGLLILTIYNKFQKEQHAQHSAG